MISQGATEDAKQMGDKLGVGSSRPRVHFDNSAEALLEVLKGNIIESSCKFKRVLVPGIAETISAPFPAVVRSPSKSRCRNAQFRIRLNYRF